MEKSNSLKDLKNLLQGKVPTDKPQPITNISPTKVVSNQLKPVNILPTAGGEADKTIPSGSQSLPADESKAKLQKTVRDQEQKIAVLEGQLTASERDKKKLTIDLEQLNQKLRTTEREIALSIQKAQELRQQRDEWRSEHNHIQGKIEAQARYARDALSKLRHLEIKNAEYQLKLDNLIKKLRL
jgi:chromosome segregation ATPase